MSTGFWTVTFTNSLPVNAIISCASVAQPLTILAGQSGSLSVPIPPSSAGMGPLVQMVTPSIAMFYNVPGVAATANFTVTGDMNVIIGQNFYAGQTVQISPTHSEYIPYITVDDPNPQPQIISTPASSPSPTPTTPTTEISPPAVLTVTVRDLILQTPIVGAVVTADGNQATTDQNGNATFAQGSYTIQVTAENYFASTTSVSSGQTQVEVDLISYALPVAVGIVLGASAIIVVGAKLVGWW